MKTALLIFAAILALVAASIGNAADNATPPPEVLKTLHYFVGDWKLGGAIGEKPIEGDATIRRVAGQDCIVGTVSFTCEGKNSSFTFLDGWDSSTGWFTENGVASDGAVYTLRWTRTEPGLFNGQLVGTANGKAQTGTYTLKQVGQDRISISGVEKIGDEAHDWKFEYSRVQTAVKVPDKVLAQMEYLIGTWETEGKLLDRAFKGTATISWAPGKHCVVSNVKSDLMTTTGLVGWDPTTNEIVETWYRADGYRIEHRISRYSESGWEGTTVLQDSSGTVKSGKIHAEKAPDGRSFTYAGTIGGETTIVGTYRRVEPKKK